MPNNWLNRILSIEIAFVSKSGIRKEDLVKKALEKRGNHPGLAHIICAMETCNTYRSWHDKKSGKTFLKSSQSKCLYYYFYFIDSYPGYGYIRVPTWCPFKLQVHINGHHIPAIRNLFLLLTTKKPDVKTLTKSPKQSK